jgi:hypothetical protein
LPGASGAGKTSLVAGLVREGWSYLSDEAAPIDPETMLVEAYPKPLSIKPGMFAGSAELLDPDRSWPISSSEWLIDPERVRIGCLADPSLIRLIVMLERDPRRSAQATALTKADAVVRLAEHVSNRAVWGGAAVATLGRVAAGAESFVLRTARPEDALRAVRELAADAAAP